MDILLGPDHPRAASRRRAARKTNDGSELRVRLHGGRVSFSRLRGGLASAVGSRVALAYSVLYRNIRFESDQSPYTDRIRSIIVVTLTVGWYIPVQATAVRQTRCTAR